MCFIFLKVHSWVWHLSTRFNNERCSISDAADGSRVGTCYTPEECSLLGGTNSGTCAGGYGTCCTCTVLVQTSILMAWTCNSVIWLSHSFYRVRRQIKWELHLLWVCCKWTSLCGRMFCCHLSMHTQHLSGYWKLSNCQRKLVILIHAIPPCSFAWTFCLSTLLGLAPLLPLPTKSGMVYRSVHHWVLVIRLVLHPNASMMPFLSLGWTGEVQMCCVVSTLDNTVSNACMYTIV